MNETELAHAARSDDGQDVVAAENTSRCDISFRQLADAIAQVVGRKKAPGFLSRLQQRFDFTPQLVVAGTYFVEHRATPRGGHATTLS
jgi:hypothetical protein